MALVPKPRPTLTLAVVLASAAAGAVSSHATPACFGAAARDVEHPCVNHRLDFTVTPSPAEALLQPSAACRVVRRASPDICTFGVASRVAPPSVALVGDSHAVHWRAALAVIARREGWQGVSLTRHRCPFSLARKPTIRCLGWVRSALRWLRDHPEIHTMFVSSDADSSVVAPPGNAAATKIDGYMNAWRALPPSVHEVFVLRDVPQSAYLTVTGCIERAIARHRNPGTRCARRRRFALRTDYEVTAAAQFADDRVREIDLTPFMCDDQRCFPVIGGVLVIKDHGHLTRTFSATLGPFIQRAVAALRQPRGARPRRAGAPPRPTAPAAAARPAGRRPRPRAPRCPGRRPGSPASPDAGSAGRRASCPTAAPRSARR
jgi:hypothetical protein